MTDHHFGATLVATKIKTNSHPRTAAAKVEIRAHLLDAMGAAKASVFDAFAGDGAMWQAVWRHAARYVGCDLEWYRDERAAYAADNRRVMRSIALDQFNIFDLDAWGSPWEQALILAARRPLQKGEKIALAITEGSGLKLKMGDYPGALAAIADMRGRATGAIRVQDQLLDRAIGGLCRRMKARPLRLWQAHGTTGAKMIYVGLIIEGAA